MKFGHAPRRVGNGLALFHEEQLLTGDDILDSGHAFPPPGYGQG
jgi:hypothetical protein